MTHEKQKTAVDWLIEQLLTQGAMKVISNSTYYFDEKIVKQAKELEKEQLKDAFLCGDDSEWHGVRDWKIMSYSEFYNETFE